MNAPLPLSGPGTVRYRPRTENLTRSSDLGPLIVDAYGAPFMPPTDPLADINAAMAGAVEIRRDIIPPVILDWTPDMIRNALGAHALGQFSASAPLVEAILADDRVQATLGSRCAALLGSEVEHSPADDSAAAAEVLDAWKQVYPTAITTPTVATMEQWGIMLGAAPFQLLWDRSDPSFWIPHLKAWHPAALRWDQWVRRYVVTTWDGQEAMAPGDGRWVLHTPYGEDRGWIMGTVRACAQPWLIKGLTWRDWARFNERHGLPIIKATVPAAGSKEMKRRFVDSLADMQQESVIMCPELPDGTRYDAALIEAKDRTWESFKGSIDRCDMSMVLALVWQNLTTQVDGGAYAAAVVHRSVLFSAVSRDEQTISETIYRQVARPFAAFNFGNANLAPRSRWKLPPPEDDKMRADTLVAFATAVAALVDAGVSFDIADLRRMANEYRIPFQGAAVAALQVLVNKAAPNGGAPPPVKEAA